MAVRADNAGEWLARVPGTFLDPTGDFTVIFTAKAVISTPAAGGYRTFWFLCQDASYLTPYVWVGSQVDSLDFSFFSFNGSTTEFVDDPTPRAADTFYQFAIVKLGDLWRFLVDGVEAASWTQAWASAPFAAEYLLNDNGASWSSTDVTGYRAWARALSDGEIAAELALSSATAPSPFTDTPLTTAADLLDLTANNHDWTAVGTLASFGPQPGGGGVYTRYYLTTKSPGVDYRVAIHGPWDATEIGDRLHGLRDYAWGLAGDPTDGGASHNWQVGETNAVQNWDILFARWLTPPLEAQTIGGTLHLAAGSVRSDAGSTVVWKVYAYVTVGDTAGVRAVLLDYTDPTDWSPVGIVRALVAAQPLAAATIQAGDHVVVEIGVRFVSNPVANNVTVFDTTAELTFGTQNGVAGATLTDAVVGGAVNHAPYVDFSQALVEQPLPAAPANDTCALATIIPALPYSDGPIDTTQAAGTADRGVWYEWTPTTSELVFFRTQGTNYNASVRVFSGPCAALVNVTFGLQNQWIQNSQTIAWWNAVAGVTYRIRVTESGWTHSAQNSGGALRVHLSAYRAPAAGDLFIDCQWITSWRDGVLINASSLFYDQTPTGAAIDYTLRPIEGHVGERLVVVLFPFQLVEYLDLPTLNRSGSEISFIDMQNDAPMNPVPPDSHPSSVVFTAAGDLIVGFFGDGYDVIGTLSTPATAYPRKVNATVVVPDAEILDTYPVQQEVQGSDYVELSSDQRTLFYTSAGRTIFRYDTVSHVQLAPFATLPVEAGPRPGLRGTRLLPPGDGSGGILVCDGINVKRLNAAGAVVQVYTPVASTRAQDLDKVELTPDATKFWVTDQLSTSFFQFDLASGSQLQDVDPQLPSGQLCGFAVYQGFRAGLVTLPPETPVDSACPTGDFPIDAGGGDGGCPVAFLP